MIKRIVKLTFQPEKIKDFILIFERHKEKIRLFPACRRLELLRGVNPDNIFFTFSFWDSEEALEKYRHSELFHDTWSKTKVLFADKPEAWTVLSMDDVGKKLEEVKGS